jgi:hypothetical protein
MFGSYLNNPSMNHWKASKRVLRYLKRMKNHILIYRRSDKLEVIGYIDSDFAGCVDSLKSISGYIFMLAGGVISWRSAKQIMIVSSTMTAEFITCFEASNHKIWLKNFITGLHIVDTIKLPLKLYCDNSSAVLYSNNNMSSLKFKHIDIKFFVVNERVQSGLINIEHIGIASILADPLTKGLIPKQFMSMSLIWVYMLQRIIKLSESLYLYFIFLCFI